MGVPRCLLCRGDAPSSTSTPSPSPTVKNRCAVSLCTIFGLAEDHPFKAIYARAQYCPRCWEEVREADTTLAKLEILKQNLLRFQNRVYSKLGDNYFQIPGREQRSATWAEFEGGGEHLKGRKFSYDDIVKILYEKLDAICFQWERFGGSGSGSGVDATTQTTAESPPPILPEGQDPDPGDSFDFSGPADDDDLNAGGNSSDDDPPDPLSTVTTTTTSTGRGGGGEVAPKAKLILPFLQPRLDFSTKILCPIDPSNCTRFFYDDYNLQVHIRSFHEGSPKPHQCPQCLRGFVDERRLKLHFLSHHAASTPLGPSFICELCGKGFATGGLLRRHTAQVHHPSRQNQVSCSFCSAPFDNAEDLQIHEGLHRAKEETPFACVYCDHLTPNSIQLKRHYKETHAHNKYPCDQCGKILNSESSLRHHLIRHQGLYTCHQCGFSGGSQNSLERHMQSHSSEKAYTCEDCGRAFKQERNLQSHRRVHTGERPFKCALCQQAFREPGDLKRHEESHSLQDNYHCDVCGKGFKMRDSLKTHRRIHVPGYKPKKYRGVRKPRTEAQKERRRELARRKREEQGLPNSRTWTPGKRRKSGGGAAGGKKKRREEEWSDSEESEEEEEETEEEYKPEVQDPEPGTSGTVMVMGGQGQGQQQIVVTMPSQVVVQQRKQQNQQYF